MKITINGSKYNKVHRWLIATLGKANKCSNKNCDNVSKKYEWAKKKECDYEMNAENFMPLCIKCHRTYDFKEETLRKIQQNSIHLKKTKCPQGHPYSPENTQYVIQKNGNRGRHCRTCNRAHQKKLNEKKKLIPLTPEQREKQRTRNRERYRKFLGKGKFVWDKYKSNKTLSK